MTMPDDKQYELIARRLDGQPVALDARQQALADEIRRDERAIAGRLDVSMPPAVMPRVLAQLTRTLEAEALRTAGRPSPRIGRVLYAGGVLSAAAAVVLAVWAGFGLLNTKAPLSKPGAVEMANLVALPVDAERIDAMAPRVDLLASAMNGLAAEMMSSPAPAGMDAKISVAEQAILDFHNDSPAPLPMRAGLEVPQ